MTPRTLTLCLIGAALGALGVGLASGEFARREALQGFSGTVRADARIRQALLESEIARYSLLPLALSDDRDVNAAQSAGTFDSPAARALNRKLERLASETGAAVIYLVDSQGNSIASSNWNRTDSFTGTNYNFRRYIRDARKTGRGRQFALGSVSGKPGLYLAQRTRAGGVVVVKLEFDWIEDEWRRAGGVTFVTNPDGLVLVTSRRDWRFVATRPLTPERQREALRDSGAGALHPKPWRDDALGLVALGTSDTPYLLADTQADAQGWQLHLAMPARTAIERPARLVALLAGLASFALALA
ncbi:sensor histidine kinase, partial [Novosphingobium sp. 1949]|nr:sensor histidine kinase [Novosphingobium organovorum]